MQIKKLTDICNPKQWKTMPTSELLEWGYPVYGANGVIGFYKEYNHAYPTIAITCRGATCGTVNLTQPKSYITGNAMCLEDVDDSIELFYLYYAMQADGYSLDDKRTAVSENDIPDNIARFHNLAGETDRERTEKSFFVPKQEIVDNDYDLSINKYKKTEYKPVEYATTSEILAEINELEVKIQEGLKELEGMLNG